MESNHPSANGATQEANGTSEVTTAEQFEQARADGIAYETHRKALAQRAKLKEEKEDLTTQLQSYKQKELEQEGKHSELIAALKQENSTLKGSIDAKTKSYQWNVVGAQIKSEFAKRGVRSPDKALQYAKAVHKDDLGTVTVDDQFNVNNDDLSRFVDKFLGDNVDMNWVSKPTVNDISPSSPSKGSLQGENKDIHNLSKDELLAKLKE